MGLARIGSPMLLVERLDAIREEVFDGLAEEGGSRRAKERLCLLVDEQYLPSCVSHDNGIWRQIEEGLGHEGFGHM
jgi:hypothetical protein